MAFLLHPAQADLQLRLGGKFGRGAADDCAIGVGRAVEVFLLLQRPADAVASLVLPWAIAELVDEAFIRRAAFIPALVDRKRVTQPQEAAVRQAWHIGPRGLIAKDDQAFDRVAILLI